MNPELKAKLSAWTEQLLPWLGSHGIKILLILAGAYLLSWLSCRIITKAIRVTVIPRRFASKEAEIQREKTLTRIFYTTTRIAIFVTAALMVLQELGVMIGPVLAGVGIVGLAFGFGGQYLIRDIISGLFIILENQYRIGDVVNFDSTGGQVEDISLRMTTLRDLDGTVHHVPHGEIKRVSNLSKNFARVNLNLRISYSANLEQVIATVNEVGKELAEDPAWKRHIIDAPKFLRVDDFGESGMVIKILGETQPLMQWDVTGELRKRIKIAFDRNGIEIPLPQRVVRQV